MCKPHTGMKTEPLLRQTHGPSFFLSRLRCPRRQCISFEHSPARCSHSKCSNCRVENSSYGVAINAGHESLAGPGSLLLRGLRRPSMGTCQSARWSINRGCCWSLCLMCCWTSTYCLSRIAARKRRGQKTMLQRNAEYNFASGKAACHCTWTVRQSPLSQARTHRSVELLFPPARLQPLLPWQRHDAHVRRRAVPKEWGRGWRKKDRGRRAGGRRERERDRERDNDNTQSKTNKLKKEYKKMPASSVHNCTPFHIHSILDIIVKTITQRVQAHSWRLVTSSSTGSWSLIFPFSSSIWAFACTGPAFLPVIGCKRTPWLDWGISSPYLSLQFTTQSRRPHRLASDYFCKLSNIWQTKIAVFLGNNFCSGREIKMHRFTFIIRTF